jgi:hypothetical protein
MNNLTKNSIFYASVGYIIFTIFLYNYGPIDWGNEFTFVVNIIVLCSCFFLAFGWKVGFRKRGRGRMIGHRGTIKLLRYGAIANVITLPLAIAAYTGGNLFDVNFSILDQGMGYRQFQQHVAETQGSPFRLLVSTIRSLLSPIIVFSVVIGIRDWMGLDVRTKLYVGLSLFSQVLFSFSRGTDKELADLFFFLVVALFYHSRFQIIKQIGKYFVVGLLLVLVLTVFVERREARFSGVLPSCFSIHFVCVNQSSTTSDLIGETNYLGLAMATNYMTQGYYGLSMALGLPFEPMYGVGHAPALTRVFDRLIGGGEFFDRPYNKRLDQFGWDHRSAWSSLYPWIANDISFWLTPLSFSVFGYMLARCWKSTLISEDPVGYVVSAHIFLGLMYSPSNNQLAVSLEMYTGFMFWLAYWFLYKPKNKRMKS